MITRCSEAGSPPSWPLAAMAIPLVTGGIVACLYALFFTWKSVRHEAPTNPFLGSAFSFKGALIFAATLTAVLFASVMLNSGLGRPGLIIATAVAGFADAHSASFSAASLVAAGKLNTSGCPFSLSGGSEHEHGYEGLACYYLRRTTFRNPGNTGLSPCYGGAVGCSFLSRSLTVVPGSRRHFCFQGPAKTVRLPFCAWIVSTGFLMTSGFLSGHSGTH